MQTSHLPLRDTSAGPDRLQVALDVIRPALPARLAAGIVLGTGLGSLANALEHATEFAYEQLPGFVPVTAQGHRGRLLVGELAGHGVILLDGRCHLYEGYDWNEVAYPTRLMCATGIGKFIVSNASGGVNPHFCRGDVMVISDHINLMFGCCAPTDARPWASPYDHRLLRRALQLAGDCGHQAHPGVYVGVRGPNYETRAEYRWMRRIGGDAVGMSTIPEVQVAALCGVPVVGLSAITNEARPDAPARVDHEEVIDGAAIAAPAIETMLVGLLADEKQG